MKVATHYSYVFVEYLSLATPVYRQKRMDDGYMHIKGKIHTSFQPNDCSHKLYTKAKPQS